METGQSEGRGRHRKGSEPSDVHHLPLCKLCSYLQPHRSRGPRKTSRTFVTFLPKKALLASRPWLAVSSLQADNGAVGEDLLLVPTSSRGSGCLSELNHKYSRRGLAVRWGLEDP